MDLKLQNILLPVEDFFDDCRGLFYVSGKMPVVNPGDFAPEIPAGTNGKTAGHIRSAAKKAYLDGIATATDGLILDKDAGCLHVSAGQTVSFCTYFNTFSLAKWLELTSISDPRLELDVEGDFLLELVGFSMEDVSGRLSPNADRTLACAPISRSIVARGEYHAPEKTTHTLEIPRTLDNVVGFELCATTDCTVFGGAYRAHVDEADTNEVELALSTTTFKKEEFVTRNISVVTDEILSGGDELSEHFSMFVVDNGRTLDADALSSERVTVFPNPNAGGAGGFARGMIEAMRSKRGVTHLILMDDDVVINPESLRRLYALLRTVRPEYRNAFLSGAMLRLEKKNEQHEDIGYVHPHGYFFPKKGERNLYDIRDIVENEVHWPDYGNEYAAWWFCCIPMNHVKDGTLPIPVFVRGDDIEFSLQFEPDIITLNGVCVWHVGFSEKYTASLELYQVIRNSMVLKAIDGSCGNVSFIMQAKQLVRAQLCQLQYDYADLVLDAVEDYLKGPDFIATSDLLAIMREKGQRNEVMKPLAEFGELGRSVDVGQVREDSGRTPAQHADYFLTYNGHLGPKVGLIDEPSTTPYDWDLTPGKQYRRKVLLAVDPEKGTAAMRVRDQRRFDEVYGRARQVFDRYRRENPAVEKAYRAASSRLKSLDFWKGYLGID